MAEGLQVQDVPLTEHEEIMKELREIRNLLVTHMLHAGDIEIKGDD